MDFVEKAIVTIFTLGWGLLWSTLVTKAGSNSERLLTVASYGSMIAAVVGLIIYEIWK